MDNRDFRFKKRNFNVSIIASILVICALAFGGYFFFKYKKLQIDSSSIADKEFKNLIIDLSSLYIFPDNEEPTVAKISDPELLKSQSFFATSLKDDVVFIFNKSNKIVLFRPSINKIIDISILKYETESSISETENNIPSSESSENPLDIMNF